MPLTRKELDGLRRAFRLSPRELELLALILDGVSTNAELAERTGLSFATTKIYVHQLLSKIGVPDKLAAAIACLKSVRRL